MNNKVHAITKGELVLMGITTPIDNNEEAIEVLNYVQKVLGASFPIVMEDSKKIVNDYICQYRPNVVKHMVANMINDMIMITFTLDDGEQTFPDRLDSEYGVFSYVYNVTYNDCSEMGYTFFKMDKDGIYRRIG